MKHAFLIIAHHEPEVLTLLLRALDDARNDVYLHVDRRAASLRRQFAQWRPEHAGFQLLERSLAVCWGDLSQVDVEYALLEAAAARGPYAYYHLLSGVDLPLRPQDELHAFFDAHQGAEFVGLWDTPSHRRDLARRVGRYYLFTRHLRDKGTLAHALTAPVRNLTLAVQKAVRWRRRANYDFRKGYNWASVTQACCEMLLAEKAAIVRRLRRTLAPDEIFLPTLVWCSPRRAHLFDATDPSRGSQRLIDWERGHPYTWREADWDELQASPLMFARKFTGADRALLRRMEQRLLG